MRKLGFFLTALLLSGIAAAQSANYTSPATITPSKVVVNTLYLDRDCGCAVIRVDEQTAGGATIDTLTFKALASDGTLSTFMAAIIASRSGETGAAARKLNFRILGYLLDNGLLTGVTLTP